MRSHPDHPLVRQFLSAGYVLRNGLDPALDDRVEKLENNRIISRGEDPAVITAHDKRIKALLKHLSRLEARLKALESLQCALERGKECTQAVTSKRLGKELKERNVNTAVFVRVPADYYDHDLEHRRQCLSAASVDHLCKSIVMENTKAPPEFRDCASLEDSRYYCVIVQYSARLHAEKLKRNIHKLNGKLGIKKFNMRLAPADISNALTGYSHNAVTPICMKTRLPIFMSDRIYRLDPDQFWMGAGEVDLKVGMSARQFVEAYKPCVIDCTYDDETPAGNCLSEA